MPLLNTESAAIRERYSVFLLAQNCLLREALTRVLCKRNTSVVGACALSQVSMEQIIAAAPDVLVMDSFIASESNRELIRGVRDEVQPCTASANFWTFTGKPKKGCLEASATSGLTVGTNWRSKTARSVERYAVPVGAGS